MGPRAVEDLMHVEKSFVRNLGGLICTRWAHRVDLLKYKLSNKYERR